MHPKQELRICKQSCKTYSKMLIRKFCSVKYLVRLQSLRFIYFYFKGKKKNMDTNVFLKYRLSPAHLLAASWIDSANS